jgi:hypothetical protein
MKFFLSSLLLVLITGIISTFLLLKTDSGIQIINNFIVDYFEKKTEYHYKVKIENLTISLPLVIQVQKISFSDKEGEFVNFEDFFIDATSSLIFPWDINLRKVSAQKINLLRLPNSNLSSSNILEESQKKTGFISIVAIPNISIHKFVLPPILTNLDNDIAFEIQGNMDLDLQNNTLNFQTKIKTDLTENELLEKKLSLTKDAFLYLKGEFNFAKNIINIENFQFSSLHSNAEGIISINFAEDLITGVLNYDSSILEYLLSDHKFLKTSCSGKIDFFGKLSAPNINTEGYISMIDSEQSYFQLPNLNWKSNFVFNQNGGSGKILFDGGGVNAHGEIGKDGSNFYLKDFVIRNAKTIVSRSSFSFDEKTKLIDGIFNVNSKNIYEFKEFFPFLKKGKLDIKTIYKREASGNQKLDVVGSAKHLSTSFFTTESIDLDLSVKNLQDFKLNRADIVIKGLVGDYGVLKSFSLKAGEKGDFINFTSQLDSIGSHPVNLKINNKLLISDLKKKLDDTNVNLQFINNVSGTIGKAKILTQQPITVSFGKVFSIVAPDIKANNGNLKLDLTVNDSLIKSKIIAANFPASVASKFLSPNFDQSLISGSVELNGNMSAPVVKILLEISNTQFLGKENIDTVLKISSHIQNKILSIDANIFEEKQVLGTLKFQIPCKFSLSPFSFYLLKKDNINANLKINKELNILSLVPLSDGNKMKGYLIGDINLTGNLESPVINGKISLSKAEYKYQIYGIKLKNISAKIIAKNKNISIMNFVAEDIYSNLLEGSGLLSINEELPFKIHMNTKKFSLINNPYLQGEINGTLLISGNSKKALAKGSFDLGPMEIKIPEHFSDNIPALNIIETINYDKKIVPLNQDKPYILEMDIDLNAKKQFYVRGRGVNALIAGNLKIVNNITDPHVFGKLKSVRGSYQEFGKFLTIRKGVLEFDGRIPSSPYLNIVGVKAVEGGEIRVILSRSIFNPDITIESTPVLSQQDALSLLLFGKNKDSISPMQAIALANGMRKLSGYGGGFDPLRLGRKILGVDDISIQNSSDKESSYLGIGKYLTDKVYLELEQGNQDFGRKTKIEIEITPKISLESTISEKGDSSFGMNWRFDY